MRTFRTPLDPTGPACAVVGHIGGDVCNYCDAPLTTARERLRAQIAALAITTAPARARLHALITPTSGQDTHA